MKVSELKPCAACGGPVTPIIYEIVVRRHFIKANAVNAVLGLNQMLGNLQIAEAFSPHSSATQLLDENRVYVCQDCGIETFAFVTEKKREESPDDSQTISPQS